MITQVKLAFLCFLAVSSASSCEDCNKTVNKAVGDVKTQVAQLLTATPGAQEHPATVVPPGASARNLSYLAMGDSVPAGEDLGGNCPHRNGRDCLASYPSLLAEQVRQTYDSGLSYSDVSCSGATSSQFLKDAQCDFNSPQVKSISARPSWVSITVGADDLIDWVKKNQICVTNLGGGDKCDLYDKVLTPFEENFRTILQAATKNSDLVVVTQYYHIFSPNAIEPYNWISGVNGAIDLLDDSIGSVARQFGSKVIVVDLRPIFATHEWGGQDSYIAGRLDYGISIDCALVPGVHPNLRGQQAIATAIWNELQQHVSR